MIRKQIYLDGAQDAFLKKCARARGVTESHLIRRSIDEMARVSAHRPGDPLGASRIIAFLDELDRRYEGSVAAPHAALTREEIYGERLRNVLG